MSSTSFSYKRCEANAFLLPNGETGMKGGGDGRVAVWLRKETGKAVYILFTRRKAVWPRARGNSDS